jgi:hypothetical protein
MEEQGREQGREQGKEQLKILVHDTNIGANELISVEEMVELATVRVELAERVPGVQGEAFDLNAWYRDWKSSKAGIGVSKAARDSGDIGSEVISGDGEAAGGAERAIREPTHLKVEAADEFQALMPWSQLEQALFLYAQEGKPLQKGAPIRLYVPNGSSECLNVKSVMKIWFLHDASLGEEATYGFKNTVTLDDLKVKK